MILTLILIPMLSVLGINWNVGGLEGGIGAVVQQIIHNHYIILYKLVIPRLVMHSWGL